MILRLNELSFEPELEIPYHEILSVELEKPRFLPPTATVRTHNKKLTYRLVFGPGRDVSKDDAIRSAYNTLNGMPQLSQRVSIK